MSDQNFSEAEYCTAVERIRKTYSLEKVDHLFRKEFYIWEEALNKWRGSASTK
ncbi:MAG: hypothetical protein V2A65_06845 [Candidatus Omnitrophota bacterium]